MSRDLDSTMGAGLGARVVSPAILCMLTFATGPQYVWSGSGTLTWNGVDFTGVGSFGQIGSIKEGVEVQADGTSVTLSGIDVLLLGDTLAEMRMGAPAKLWLALLTPSLAIVGTPYLMFVGQMDEPTISVGGETFSITIALENKLVDLQRASCRRYTAADQHLSYPDDTAFNWVEALNDQALKWGMA